MPKKAIDYSKTIIYKLVCKDTTIADLYVGSTTSFVDRKKTHKKCCMNVNDNLHHLKVYEMIRANGGWTEWEMIMVEDYPCENKLQAHQRERYWLETLHATMNANIPSRTLQEWYEVNADKIKKQKKKYNEVNKEKMKIYFDEYREINKEKRKEYMKQYCEENKEKLKEYRRKYREAKKEQIKNVA